MFHIFQISEGKGGETKTSSPVRLPTTTTATTANVVREPGPKKNDQFFGLFVYRNDLLVEVPSFDGRTLNDPRLQMQEEMCPEIKQLLGRMHLGIERGSVVIQGREVNVFKIEIGDRKKAVAAVNIIKEYLASRSIPIIAILLDKHYGVYKKVLLNTTKAYDRTEVLMKIEPRVDPGVAEVKTMNE